MNADTEFRLHNIETEIKNIWSHINVMRQSADNLTDAPEPVKESAGSEQVAPTMQSEFINDVQGAEIKRLKAELLELENLRRTDAVVIDAYHFDLKHTAAELDQAYERMSDMLKHIQSSDFPKYYRSTFKQVESWFDSDGKAIRGEVSE